MTELTLHFAPEYSHFARHDEQLQQRPAVQRALSTSKGVADSLAAQGLAVTFSGPGATRTAEH